MPRPRPEIARVQMPLRVPPDLKAGLERAAEQSGLTLNQLCVEALERELKRRAR